MPTPYTKINYRIFPVHCPSKIRRSQDIGSFIVSHAFLRWLNKATDIPIEGRNDRRSATHQALVCSQTILYIAVDSSSSVAKNTVDLLTNLFLFTRPVATTRYPFLFNGIIKHTRQAKQKVRHGGFDNLSQRLNHAQRRFQNWMKSKTIVTKALRRVGLLILSD